MIGGLYFGQYEISSILTDGDQFEEAVSLFRVNIPGSGWKTVPAYSGAITRINTEIGGWRTGQLEPGLIRVFKNGMWQTVQYP